MLAAPRAGNDPADRCECGSATRNERVADPRALARKHIGEIARVPRNLTLQTIVCLARAFDTHVSELLARAKELAREQASNQRSPDSSATP